MCTFTANREPPVPLLGNAISGLFGASPIKPLQTHMARAHECAAMLAQFLDAVLADDWDTAVTLQQRIAVLENEADDIKMSIRLRLPKSLFLPVPREDLLELLHVQELVANGARDIAGIMLGRRMQVPDALKTALRDFLATATATTAQALKATSELDELLETGFSGPEVSLVENLIRTLNDLEHDNDVAQITIRGQLFALEKDLPPVDVMFLYRVIDGIGDLANAAQRVGSRLQMLIAR